MRFIKKGASPDFFEKEKAVVGLTVESKWNEFQNPCKSRFTDYLVQEQNGLCAYCECDLTSPVTGSDITRSRHLEHIAPQGEYPELRFSYHNLVASCDGQLLASERIKQGESCGHRKNKEYGESWFLNPVNDESISEYFSFDSQDGSILPAATNRSEDTQEMINILNLDAPYLKNARLNSKEVLVEYLISLEPEQAELLLSSELESPREFISFLKHCFT